MNHGTAVFYGIMTGLAMMSIIYGAYRFDTVPTGKVSATMISYSAFSIVAGIVVVLLALGALYHHKKTPKKFL